MSARYLSPEARASSAVTYFPKAGAYVRGERTHLSPHDRPIASVSVGQAADGAERTVSTRITDPGMQRAAQYIAGNAQAIKSGMLTAADARIGFEDLDPLVLVRLYNRLIGEQMTWFHLDNMFTELPLNQLVYRMSYRDNVANAQEVPERAEFDVAGVPYDGINFHLTKIMNGFDITIEDKLRATIDPVSPMRQGADYGIKFAREKRALAALKEIGNYYQYNKDPDKASFSETKPGGTGDSAKFLPDPSLIAGTNNEGFHSKTRTANQIQYVRNLFFQKEDIQLTHAAMSPKTIMDIAQNTWTEPNTVNNVSAYRTDGGVLPFPGIPGMTAVVSMMVPDNVLYMTCKPHNCLIKAEGPKTTKTWYDNNHNTEITANLDFHQYKCAHPELTKITRKFGCTVYLTTADAGANDERS